MRRIVLCACFMAAGGGLFAANPAVAKPAPGRAVVPVVRHESSVAPLVVVAPDSGDARRALAYAEEAWRIFATTLQVKAPPAETRIVLQWVVVKEPAALPSEFPVRLALAGKRKDFIIEWFGDASQAREPVVRSVMGACLQALAWDGQMPAPGGSIAHAPFWMSEGLVQRLLDRRIEDTAQIIHRLERAKALPKLEEIQGWEDAGELRQEKLIRRAVTNWLFRQATGSPVEAESLKLWWQSQRDNSSPRYWDDSGQSEGWWHRVAEVRGPVGLPVLSWEQTANHVREALHFSARLKGEKESRLLSILDLPEAPSDLENPAVVQEVVKKLVDVESRAHWLWPYVLEKYRAALDSWSAGRYVVYRQQVDQALVIQGRMDGLVKRSEDYLDWFTVNYPLQVPDPEWEDYRRLAVEMESARAPFQGTRPGPAGIIEPVGKRR
ncbi:MAG: hypothetical protein SFU85_09055 [Candidatus Methylacidiphilales bacterium]|nr:hypothetical protein [Candidatus Methylacidiphilales bacterium]